MPIYVPFCFFRPLDLNRKWYQQDPQRAHPCVERCRMAHRSLKSVHWCDLRAWRSNQKRQKNLQWQTGYSPRPPTSSHQNEILRGGRRRELVLRFKFHQNRLSGFWDVECRNLPFPITLAIVLYNSLYYRTSRAVAAVHACTACSRNALRQYWRFGSKFWAFRVLCPLSWTPLGAPPQTLL